MKKSISLLFIVLYAIPLFSMIKTGERAPYFQVTDGNSRTLYSTDLQGKAVIGFYESRETSDKNNALKDELNRYRSGTESRIKNDTFRLAVIDATEANMATAWVWRKNFVKKSAEIGINIYGDWDGSMKKRFSFPENESVFIIIDKQNIVRYTYTGKVPQSEFGNIRNLIRKIMSE